MNKRQTLHALQSRYRKYLKRYRSLQAGELTCRSGATKNEAWLLKKLRTLRQKIQQIIESYQEFSFRRAAMVASIPMALSLSVPSASAQSFIEVPLSSVDVGDVSNPSFVDIDNDGDFDLFIGDYDGALTYYENTGDASSFNFELGTPNPLAAVDAAIPFYSSAAFIDIDDDGDFDAFIGEYDGAILYYENTGSAGSPTFVQRTGGLNPLDGVDALGLFSTAPAFADLDNDEDFDVLIGEYGGAMRYFLNTGDKTTATFVEQTGGSNPMNGVDVGGYASPGFVDIDDDGDFDLFVGETDGVFNYYENTGTILAPTFTARAGGLNPMDGFDVGGRSKPAIVDINNDGDFDILSGADDGTIPDFFINAGTAGSPAFSRYTPLLGETLPIYTKPALVDLDNDGDFDILSGEGSGVFFYYENTGEGRDHSYVARTGVDNPMNTFDVGLYSSPSLVDIDDDGDFDLFSGLNGNTIVYYRNDGTASSPSFTAVAGAGNPLNGVTVGNYSNCAFVDIDDDDDFDVFIGPEDGTFYYYENTGTSSSPTFTARVGAGNNPLNGFDAGVESTPAFIDFDDDGDFDMISGNSAGVFYYYENTGNSSTPSFPVEYVETDASNPLQNVDVGGFSQVIFGDIDKDGDGDILAGNTAGTFPFFVGIGTGAAAVPVELAFFGVTQEGGDVRIEWHTALEIDNDYFELERSLDGAHFDSIEKIKGAGNSNSVVKYSTLDTNVPYGIIYYRLKQVDFDGTVHDEGVRIINTTGATEVTLYPTLVVDVVNVLFPAVPEGTAAVSIVDGQGRTIFVEERTYTVGDNQLIFGVDALPPGIYFFKTSFNGSTPEIHRIVKQ